MTRIIRFVRTYTAIEQSPGYDQSELPPELGFLFEDGPRRALTMEENDVADEFLMDTDWKHVEVTDSEMEIEVEER